MVKKPFLSVIVPTHNHARHIMMTLADVHRHLEEQPYPSEIIVVDDHSHDGTPEMVLRYAGLIPHLRLLRNEKTMGRSFVMQQGMLMARGAWRTVVAADHAVPVVEFNKVIPHARDGYQIFTSPDHDFQCFSAKAAEKIFSHPKSFRARRAKKMGYKVKIVRVQRTRPRSPLAWLTRLWQNV